MHIIVLNKDHLTTNAQDQIYELFKQLSPKKKQLKLDEVLTENNQVTLLGYFIGDRILG